MILFVVVNILKVDLQILYICVCGHKSQDLRTSTVTETEKLATLSQNTSPEPLEPSQRISTPL